MAAKRGRTITSFGQFFSGLSGGVTAAAVVPTAQGVVYSPLDEGIIETPVDEGVVETPVDEGTISSEDT